MHDLVKQLTEKRIRKQYLQIPLRSKIKEKTMMKRGKRICNTLKEVRMQVAKANNIKYAPTECHYEGDCAGTCPKCESEVRWLEQQLQLRRQLGKAVAVVGVSMGLAALTSCGGKASSQDAGEMIIDPDTISEATHTVAPHVADTKDVPDTLSSARQAIDLNNAQETVPDTPLAMSQAVEPKIFDVVGGVDLMPSFPGGYQALLEFLQENIKYPEQAEKDSIWGKVVVKFVVETDGSITNPQVVKSVHPLLDAEALRTVSIMPKWEPNRPGVFNLPITFKLD